jgi:Protein of unknown function (DUF732)
MDIDLITHPLRLAKRSQQPGSLVIGKVLVGAAGAVISVMGSRGVITACATAAAIALAPAAHAYGSDDNFLAMLSAAGIPVHDGIPGVISYGHKVCDALGGGRSPSDIANALAQYSYAENPSHPLDQYQRTMVVFVGVSSQAYCPGHAAAYHGGYRIVLTGQDVPLPGVPDVPDVAHATPPVVVAKPKQNPPPQHKPPPPPEVAPLPSQESQTGQGKDGAGSGIDGGGSSGGGVQQPAPEPPEGHISLLP